MALPSVNAKLEATSTTSQAVTGGDSSSRGPVITFGNTSTGASTMTLIGLGVGLVVLLLAGFYFLKGK